MGIHLCRIAGIFGNYLSSHWNNKQLEGCKTPVRVTFTCMKNAHFYIENEIFHNNVTVLGSMLHFTGQQWQNKVLGQPWEIGQNALGVEKDEACLSVQILAGPA